MAQSIALRIITQEGAAIDDDAVSVVAPGELGYLGILRNHAPLVTTLKPGKLTWRRPSGEQLARRIGEGLLEVVRNTVTVLTDTISAPQSVASERSLP